MMRISTLMGVFALAAAAFLIYQAQNAGALVAIEPAPAEVTAKKTEAHTQYGTFTCTPDNFTLTSTAEGYHLRGTIETPTPGYGYIPTRIDETPDAADMVFELRGPQDSAAQVISKMEIDHMYVRDGSMETLTLRLDKTFNWGTDTIVCKNTAPQKDTPVEAQPEEPAVPQTDAPATE